MAAGDRSSLNSPNESFLILLKNRMNSCFLWLKGTFLPQIKRISDYLKPAGKAVSRMVRRFIGLFYPILKLVRDMQRRENPSSSLTLHTEERKNRARPIERSRRPVTHVITETCVSTSQLGGKTDSELTQDTSATQDMQNQQKNVLETQTCDGTEPVESSDLAVSQDTTQDNMIPEEPAVHTGSNPTCEPSLGAEKNILLIGDVIIRDNFISSLEPNQGGPQSEPESVPDRQSEPSVPADNQTVCQKKKKRKNKKNKKTT